MKLPKYMVCTICATYNHAPYIVDALNGFCMQETSFPVVSVIIDDASQDEEQEVIKTYLQDNFDLKNKEIVRQEETDDYNLIFAQHKTNKCCYFAVLFLKYNHYSIKKDKRPYYAEWENSSKYIALCEGDDYWTDPLKLQRQVDALELHSEIDMCACGANVIQDGISVGKKSPYDTARIISVEEVIEGGGGFFATNSLIYRYSLVSNDTYCFWRLMNLDYFTQIRGAIRGGVFFLPQCMATYRYCTPNSWTQSMSNNPDSSFDHKDKVLHTLCILDHETGYKYSSCIKKVKIHSYFSLFRKGISGCRFDEIIIKMKFKSRIKLMWILLCKFLQKH